MIFPVLSTSPTSSSSSSSTSTSPNPTNAEAGPSNSTSQTPLPTNSSPQQNDDLIKQQHHDLLNQYDQELTSAILNSANEDLWQGRGVRVHYLPDPQNPGLGERRGGGQRSGNATGAGKGFDGGVFSCYECLIPLALQNELISKSFSGRAGRAYLLHSTINTVLGKTEERRLLTGLHTVADLLCIQCGTSLGWIYLKANEVEQVYKEGKYILEAARVVRENGWVLEERGK